MCRRKERKQQEKVRSLQVRQQGNQTLSAKPGCLHMTAEQHVIYWFRRALFKDQKLVLHAHHVQIAQSRRGSTDAGFLWESFSNETASALEPELSQCCICNSTITWDRSTTTGNNKSTEQRSCGGRWPRTTHALQLQWSHICPSMNTAIKACSGVNTTCLKCVGLSSSASNTVHMCTNERVCTQQGETWEAFTTITLI